MLFIPDLINYLFTDVKCTEYTIASTSQMLDAGTHNWCESLIKETNIPLHILTGIIQPGSTVGLVKKEIADSLSIKTIPVIAVAEHDTGSAIVAIPALTDNFAYLSSGTWSLMGIEIDKPVRTAKSLEYGFTNEGGIDGTIRYLKNICGLWLLEQCKRQWDRSGATNYTDLIKLAEQAESFKSFIDPDDAIIC